MIRSYQDDDIEQVTQLINIASSKYKMLDTNEIKESSVEFIVYVEQEVILGIAYAISLINDANESEAQIKVFVDTPYRLHGIGKSLVGYLERNLIKRNTVMITSYFKVDLVNPAGFCDKAGYKKWWGSPELFYVGPGFPDVAVDFVLYEDKYFDSYLQVVQESFYEVHVINDIKPYIVTEEIVRRYKLNNKENVYLLFEDDKILASVTIGKGTVENLMVSKTAQGKGYGKKALQFAINKMMSQGNKEIRISYMEGNDSAKKLYLSLGFKPLHNTHVYRRIIKNN